MSLASVVKDFAGIQVLVLGDLLLDEYVWGSVRRVSPEAPVPVLHVQDRSMAPGGAANVAANLARLGARARLFGVVGDDPEGQRLVELLRSLGVACEGVLVDTTRPTVTKTRLMAGSQQIARVDRESTAWLSPPLVQLLTLALQHALSREGRARGLIISDYAKGTLTPDLTAWAIGQARQAGLLVAVGPKGRDYRKYHGATVLVPNAAEAQEVSSFPTEGEEGLLRASETLAALAGCEGVVITRGAKGASLYIAGGSLVHVPARAREVFDVTGAGDTFVSAFALAYLACGDWQEAVEIANAAAGIVVGKVGTATVGQRELAEELEGLAHRTWPKVLPRTELLAVLARTRASGRTIVFTNGCFDLLHVGHIKLLEQAKALGDTLVVAINDDASVGRLKGLGRPLVLQEDRARVLAALDVVDYVTIFSEDTPLELLQVLHPDVLVKGADYRLEEIVGKELVESYGGRVATVPLVEGVSTSTLVQRVKENTAQG